MDTIYYLGYYDRDDNAEQARNYVRSATTKMDYIAEKLASVGYNVQIVSMAGTKLPNAVSGKNTVMEKGIGVRLFPSLGSGGPLKRGIARLAMEWRMKRFLCSLKSSDMVLAYHSLGYANIVREAKAKIGFRLILEVEEFYADVTGSEEDTKLEVSIFEVADAFLCSTELLAERFRPTGKSSVVCSGIYKMANKIAEKRNDGKIHVVYAGTLDPRKGGAAAAGSFLGREYHMHILGFRGKEEIDAIEAAVSAANKKSKGAVITYDGYLSGKEFTSFIQSCDIGLSPQDPNAKFNTTSFPSKIFMYLTNGLPVVSVDLPVFRRQDLREVLYLSRDNTPSSLSATIKSVKKKDTSPIDAILRMDEEFGIEIKRMLEGLKNAN